MKYADVSLHFITDWEVLMQQFCGGDQINKDADTWR